MFCNLTDYARSSALVSEANHEKEANDRIASLWFLLKIAFGKLKSYVTYKGIIVIG